MCSVTGPPLMSPIPLSRGDFRVASRTLVSVKTLAPLRDQRPVDQLAGERLGPREQPDPRRR